MSSPTDDSAPSTETGVRRRTRSAILDAALTSWARDWGAPLAEIADRAAVSRSTLHRYFPDRQALVDAAKERAILSLESSAVSACSGCSSAREELDALMRAMVDVGDAVIFLFSDPNRFGSDLWSEDADEHADLRDVVVRAQAEGAVADDVEPDWVIEVFYSLVYVAAEAINAGTLPRHRAADVAARTLFGGVGADR